MTSRRGRGRPHLHLRHLGHRRLLRGLRFEDDAVAEALAGAECDPVCRKSYYTTLANLGRVSLAPDLDPRLVSTFAVQAAYRLLGEALGRLPRVETHHEEERLGADITALTK